MELTAYIENPYSLQKEVWEGLCMLGGIYSDQRCPFCGSRLKDNRKNGVVCPVHPDQVATKFRVYFKGVRKRFGSYAEASRFFT